MPKAYPSEFREDVVRVARNRPAGATLEQLAADFGVHPMTLSKWMRKADVEDGVKPGATNDQLAELRDAKRRIRTLEMERGAAPRRGVSVAGQPAGQPGEMIYPLVRELADDGVPVASDVPGAHDRSSAVLPLARAAGHRRRTRRGISGQRPVRRPPQRPRVGYRFLADEARDVGLVFADRTAWRICLSNGWWSVFGKKRRGKKAKIGAPAHDDLVRRDFTASGPNRLWLSDITEHPTGEGKLALPLRDQGRVVQQDRRLLDVQPDGVRDRRGRD